MSLGVRLSAAHWFELTGYVLVALMPFAVIGIILGHLLTVDSMGPALGGLTVAVRHPRRVVGPARRRAGSCSRS